MTDWFEYRWLAFLALLAATGSVALAFGASLRVSLLIGFDLAGTTLLAVLGGSMILGGAAYLREQAERVDAGRWAVLLMSIVLSSAALASLGMEMQATEQTSQAHILLAVASILVAWLLMNTMFAFHYAHVYYVGEQGSPGGLDFPGTSSPDYFDFLYFALVLGMTFQVSDVNIVSSRIRRIALGHALTAFFFNLVVLALAVNLLVAA